MTDRTSQLLRVLIVEDSDSDAELVVQHLKENSPHKGGPAPQSLPKIPCQNPRLGIDDVGGWGASGPRRRPVDGKPQVAENAFHDPRVLDQGEQPEPASTAPAPRSA